MTRYNLTNSDPGKTFFAPAERLGETELSGQIHAVLNSPIVNALLDMVDSYAIIINHQRQVLAANPEIIEAFEINNSLCLKGLRPGELFQCVHAVQGPNGCGTSMACRECGALLSILECQTISQASLGECRLTIEQNGIRKAAEFHVRSSPLLVDGYNLTLIVLRDISALKRREILERVFFHDILNTIGGIRAWVEMLKRNKEPQTAAQKIALMTERITQEINEHRMLLQAEEGRLVLNWETVDAQSFLDAIGETFEGHDVKKGKHLQVHLDTTDSQFLTDRVILLRVLINLVKNAFEAIPSGAIVTVCFFRRDGEPCFVVKNPGVIPEKVAMHIFERSFSTKASHGRGIGTYSIKLFGETFLRGRVFFTTDETEGTQFFITLPPPTSESPPAQT
ncbi:MAG: HAMP domain-containing sensor histidine kinase [bacterium]|jgi:signal transduction histidine kinase|nr:HAMP domain-containing sensor histidine kinase [bacterium]